MKWSDIRVSGDICDENGANYLAKWFILLRWRPIRRHHRYARCIIIIISAENLQSWPVRGGETAKPLLTDRGASGRCWHWRPLKVAPSLGARRHQSLTGWGSSNG